MVHTYTEYKMYINTKYIFSLYISLRSLKIVLLLHAIDTIIHIYKEKIHEISV